MKILAIDDINDNLISLNAIIKDAFPDSTVFSALDGSKGIELAIAEDPDVILLDIVMPDMDGFEVCRLLKQDQRTQDIPVVFITALKGDKENRIKALDAGAEAFLSKPIDETELTAQIRAMAKIKVANEQKRDEKIRLKRLVTERTQKLELSQIASINLLNELKAENEARKKTEAALRESEYFFKESQRAAFVGSYKFDFINDFWTSSEVLEQIFGIDNTYIRSIQGWLDIAHPDDREMMDRYFREEVVAKRKLFNNEYRIIRKSDGEIRWVLGLGKLVLDAEDNIVSMIGTIQDITERKQAEEAIHKSEKRYRHLVEQSPTGIAIYQEGKFVYVNPAGVTIFGGSNMQELVGKSVLSIVHPDSRDEVIRRMSLVSNGISVPVLEEKLIRFDGSPFYAEVIALNTTHNDMPAGQVIVWDITKRKRAEESLQKLNLAIRQSQEIIFMTDKEGIISFINPEFTKTYGYSAEEIIGKVTPRILKSGFLSKEVHEYLWMKILSKESIKAEYKNKRKDGSLIDIEGSADPILDENGEIIGFLGIHKNITERKQAEVNLIAAKEKAEESDRLKSAFLANMSHEIRTPLNSIIGFSDLMLDPFFGSDQHAEFAGIIKENGNNLLAIISDIMDLSKIEAGQVQVQKAILSVNQLITDIQKEYSFKAIEKGIELRLDPSNPKEKIFIDSDENRLRQILANLVSNSIKFTEKGFVGIGIRITRDFIQFQVKDTGIGIPKEFQEQIFERFRQVETAHTRKYGGNGLGLPISKSLVELLGGTIWMESEQGKGSTFFFTIPC